MAITSLSDLIAKMSDPAYTQSLRVCRLGRVGGNAAATPIASVPVSTWQYEGDGCQGSAPGSTPATCSRTTQGAIRIANATGGRTNYLTGGFISSTGSGNAILIDRLAHVSGLSGTTTTEQSFSSSLTLPARASDGVGVLAALEVYSQIGTSGTSFQLKYTNTADATGQLSPVTSIGGTSNRNAQLWRTIPLASGDLGVKSGQSVDLLASTGTVGDFGITLFKVIAMIPLNMPKSFISGAPDLPIIPADSCLELIVIPNAAVVHNVDGLLHVVEA
jgi:hypothetical protein